MIEENVYENNLLKKKELLFEVFFSVNLLIYIYRICFLF